MLSYELNKAIIRLAPRFEAKDFAPSSFEELKSCSVLNTLPVWSGASEKTIYGCPKVNHAFRAWHDSLHLELNAPFTLKGEILVAKEQARLIQNDTMGKIIMLEVQGQAEYLKSHGVFPENQIDFIKARL